MPSFLLRRVGRGGTLEGRAAGGRAGARGDLLKVAREVIAGRAGDMRHSVQQVEPPFTAVVLLLGVEGDRSLATKFLFPVGIVARRNSDWNVSL